MRRILFSSTNFPYALAALSAYIGEIQLLYDPDIVSPVVEIDGVKEHGDEYHTIWSIAGSEVAGSSNELATFFALSQSLRSITNFEEATIALARLDDHLTFRTYLVGHDITASDFTVWGSIKGSIKLIGLLRSGHYSHLSRWFSHIDSLPSTQTALASLAEAKIAKARSGSKTASSFALGLPNATMGNVVTRFPPEPSGYLHIGHAKAAMLNQYFAKMYKGRLIVRFDDTNPTKEKTEFENTILEDLQLLGVEGDVVTHTSDHFEKLYDLAIQMIESGNAYADDTDNNHPVEAPCACPANSHGKQSQLAYERWHGLPSKRRNGSIDDNLMRFTNMKNSGTDSARWCLRAKISVDDPNKAMRDPVIYRVNPIPHHRTGERWKIYPTYDFACPIVDSLEGVTHALRTNEYRDRNPQYMWMNQALGLRPVQIWDYSRLNFVYTLLSKRKLHWFVDRGLVQGWDDPRFPTVRGIRRRGMTIEALAQFMLSQGPSQAIVSLEWDSIWSLNKKIIDPIAPHFWAILRKSMVYVTITNGPTTPETKTQPKHKKNLEIGFKNVVYASSILIEQVDALHLEDQEEITLMSWGNAIVLSREISGSGEVTAVTLKLHLEGDFRLTKKKVTWLAAPSIVQDGPNALDVTLVDYDYLITKKKLEENDNLADYVTPISKFSEDALADPNIAQLSRGDIIQFERKGYYIFDGLSSPLDGQPKPQFIRIPDGKGASLASKAVAESSTTGCKPKISGDASQIGVVGAVGSNLTPKPGVMYEVKPIVGNADVAVPTTSMYHVPPVFTDIIE